MMSMEAPHKRPEAIDIALILSRMLPPLRIECLEPNFDGSILLPYVRSCITWPERPRRCATEQRDERAAPHGSLSFQARGRRLPTCAGGPRRCLRPHAPQPGPSLWLSEPFWMG